MREHRTDQVDRTDALSRFTLPLRSIPRLQPNKRRPNQPSLERVSGREGLGHGGARGWLGVTIQQLMTLAIERLGLGAGKRRQADSTRHVGATGLKIASPLDHI